MTGVAVIGIHRSGTSAVAGVLYHLGVFMGDDLLPPSIHNPKGYFEDRRFVELHTKVMEGGWKNPTHIDWGYAAEYPVLLAEFQKHGLWGIKDPRLCYLLPYLRAYVDPLKVVAVFRDPYVAANSLFKRGGHTMKEAREISLRYLKAMMRNVPDDALWVYYNDLIDAPGVGVAEIAEYIGVEPTQEAIDFIDRHLRHWR